MRKSLAMSDVFTDELASFRNKHAGRRCFVVGCAPSLAKLDLTRLNGDLVFIVNRGYLLAQYGLPQSAYHIFSDHLTYEAYWQEIRCKSVGIRFYRANVFNLPEYQTSAEREPAISVPFHMLPTMDEGHFAKDVTQGLYRGFTVVLDAVQVAFFMGFDEVYIIGCDLDYQGAQTHIYGSGAYEQRRRFDMPTDKVLRAMSVASEVFQTSGRLLANAGIGDRLDTIPRVQFESLFSS